MAARLSFSNFLQQDSLGSKYAATAEAIELNMAAQTYQWQPWNSSFSNFLPWEQLDESMMLPLMQSRTELNMAAQT